MSMSLLIRGVLALIIGILALAFPVGMIEFIVYLVGILILVLSICGGGICLSSSAPPAHRWGLLALSVIGVIIAILTFISPVVMVLAITFLIALWAFVTGIGDLGLAFSGVQKEHRLLFGLTGIIAIIFGLMVVAMPLEGALAIITVLGIFGVIFGVASIIAGIMVRGNKGASLS